MAKRLFDRIAEAGISLHREPYAVNIGSGDGKEFNDPVYPLYISGFSGLAIEARDVPALGQNLGHLPIVLRPKTLINPDNIVAILREAHCPPNFEFLKVDIDGFDAAVTAAILAGGFRPLVIQLEVNSEFPPPIAFSVAPHPKYVPGGQTGFFGCSLSYAADLLGRYEYELIQLDFMTKFTHDSLFVRREMLSWGLGVKSLASRDAFLAEIPLLPHLDNVRAEQRLAWRTRTDFEAMRDQIWTALSEANEKKHGHREVPFELYLS